MNKCKTPTYVFENKCSRGGVEGYSNNLIKMLTIKCGDTPAISAPRVAEEKGPLESMSSRPAQGSVRFCLKKQKQRSKRTTTKLKF